MQAHPLDKVDVPPGLSRTFSCSLCQHRVPSSLKPCRGAGSPVRIPIGVEGTHVVHLLQVDVGEDQLVVAAVDDGGAVRAGEHIGGGQGAESPQDCGLSAKGHLLTVTQQACRKGTAGWEQGSTELRGRDMLAGNEHEGMHPAVSKEVDASIRFLSSQSPGEIHLQCPQPIPTLS